MSKSKGNVITVSDMLKYMKPEHLRYWMFQGKLTIAKDINLSKMVPHLFDEFDKAERIFFGKETTGDKRRDNNYKRAYELAVEKPKKKLLFKISYESFVEIVKILPEKNQAEFVIKKLKEFGYSEKISKSQMKYLEERINLVKNWIKDFQKIKKIEIEINENERIALKKLIEKIKSINNEERLQSEIFKIAKSSEIKPVKFFKLIYKILLNSESGPKLGYYILDVGKEEVINKLKSVL
jgi:lysyl-tRNA synthetase class 1